MTLKAFFICQGFTVTGQCFSVLSSFESRDFWWPCFVHLYIKEKNKKNRKDLIIDHLVQAYQATRDTVNLPNTFKGSLTVYLNVRLRHNSEHFLMVTIILMKKVGNHLHGVQTLSKMSTENSVKVVQQTTQNKNAEKWSSVLEINLLLTICCSHILFTNLLQDRNRILFYTNFKNSESDLNFALHLPGYLPHKFQHSCNKRLIMLVRVYWVFAIEKPQY